MNRRSEIWRDSALTRPLESREATTMATSKLDGADFVSEERSQDGLLALSQSHQVRRGPDALRAPRLDRVERIADQLFQRSGYTVVRPSQFLQPRIS